MTIIDTLVMFYSYVDSAAQVVQQSTQMEISSHTLLQKRDLNKTLKKLDTVRYSCNTIKLKKIINKMSTRLLYSMT